MNKKKGYCIDTLNRKLITPLNELLQLADKDSLENFNLFDFKKKYAKVSELILQMDMNSFDVPFHNKRLLDIEKNYRMEDIKFYDEIITNENEDKEFFNGARIKIAELLKDLTEEIGKLK